MSVLASSPAAKTRLCVYTNSALTNLELIVSSGADWSTNASASFTAQENVFYQIAVFGNPQEIADFTFTLTMQTLRFISPLDGSTHAAPAKILLNAQIDGVLATPTRMEYYANESLLAALDEPPFTWMWQGMPPGTYILKAVCTLPGGVTNCSLPVTILIYTNNDLPTPKIFAGPESHCSYVINAVGSLYVLGRAGTQFGVNTNEDAFHPRLGKWPAGVTRWQAIDDGWALSSQGELFTNGTTRIPFPAGVQRWLSLANIRWLVGDDGRVYTNGQAALSFAASNQRWISGACAYAFGATLTSDHRLYFHRNDFYGQPASAEVPFPAGVTAWQSLHVNLNMPVILGNDGNLYYEDSLGVGLYTSISLVSKPAGVSNWTAFAVGGYHVLAIGSDGQLYGWGRNWEGQLGLGSSGTYVFTPSKVELPAGVTAWTAVAAGYEHTLAIGNDGALYAWGCNTNGQLGIGPLPQQDLPFRVSNLGSLCGIPIISTGGDSIRLPDGTFRLRFKTDLNRSYQIQYSDDMHQWKTASSIVTGNGEIWEWIDDGPPKTDSSPTDHLTRFYRIVYAY